MTTLSTNRSNTCSEAQRALRASRAAEARGDAVEALRSHDQVSRLGRSMHRDLLATLVELDDRAPGWMYSRWMTAQADDPPGTDERDWVLRQRRVYDDGGLRRLVETRASAELLDRADHVEEWVGARMGGYRLESDVDGCLQLTDLADDSLVEVLDLGLAAQHGPGSCFLCRVVPTRERPGLMFEWRPLPVDETTARQVAAEPARWLATVTDAARTHVGGPARSTGWRTRPSCRTSPRVPGSGCWTPSRSPG